MRVCALSDVHGQFEVLSVNPVDLLFICGDIVPLNIQRSKQKSFVWLKEVFIPWCEAQPVNHVYMVAGNHDFALEDEKATKELFEDTKITILYNEFAGHICDTGSCTIWGSPNCHIFGNWAFMYPNEYNKEQYEKMPENVTFLLTHDAAYEHSDQCLGFQEDVEKELHRGNIPLKEVVEEKKPKIHLFGHLHTCDHRIINYDGVNTACVSLLDEDYNMIYKPLYIEL